jgi:hypothetical protein
MSSEFFFTLYYGRKDYSPEMKAILKEMGDLHIQEMYIVRTPLSFLLSSALTILTLNKINQNNPYDKLFHLGLLIVTSKGRYSIEKNEIITMTKNPIIQKETESMQVEITHSLTTNELLENTRNSISEDRFYNYDSKYINCQDFIADILRANQLDTQYNILFIKQNTDEIFKNLSGFRKFGRTLTDIASRISVIRHGKGVRKSIKGKGSASSILFGTPYEQARDILESDIEQTFISGGFANFMPSRISGQNLGELRGFRWIHDELNRLQNEYHLDEDEIDDLINYAVDRIFERYGDTSRYTLRNIRNALRHRPVVAIPEYPETQAVYVEYPVTQAQSDMPTEEELQRYRKTGKGLSRKNGLTDSDIVRLLKHDKKFVGKVYMRDELPDKLERNKWYVINMQAGYEGDGTHWVCFKTGKPFLYFDPLIGGDPPIEVLEYAQKMGIEFKMMEIEDVKATSCGWFCVACILSDKGAGSSLVHYKRFLSRFSKNTQLNDLILHNLLVELGAI